MREGGREGKRGGRREISNMMRESVWYNFTTSEISTSLDSHSQAESTDHFYLFDTTFSLNVMQTLRRCENPNESYTCLLTDVYTCTVYTTYYTHVIYMMYCTCVL